MSAADLCAGIPVHVPGAVDLPTFALPDPGDAPPFPNVGGDMSPAIANAFWFDHACFFGGEAMVQPWLDQLPGINFKKLIVATADDMVEETFDTVNLFALSSPGQDATPMLPSFPQITLAAGGARPEEFHLSVSTATLAGRNVTVFTDANDDHVIYAFVSGDTLYGLRDATEDLAATVFGAFP
jgi:hypothetical protein